MKPCYEYSYTYQCEILECIGFIENCIVSKDCDNIILLGDFNFECNDHSTALGIT